MSKTFLQARGSHYYNNTAGIFFENIKEPAYKSAITNNTFSSDTTILNNGCAGVTGILALNSTDIEIGDSLIATSGNQFHDLYSGIIITGDTNMPYVLNNNASRIGIYNNKFSNITNCSITGSYPESQKINGCYGGFFGAGVYANFGMVPSTFDARIDIRNTHDTNTVLRFENCDKAIVTKNTSVTAKNLYLNHNLMGIMCNATTNKNLKIENNFLKYAAIGMQFLGNNNNSYVRSNTIDSLYGVQSAPGNYSWGKGIDVQNFINTDTSIMDVQNNIINQQGYAGVGINMQNTGSNVKVYENDIALTYDNTNIIVCAGATLLNGINASNIKNSNIEGNHVNGNDSIVVAEREDIAGILINNSIGYTLHCNHVAATRFGMEAISRCNTDTLNVKGNTMMNHILGWSFRHLGTEGTFGDVGTANYDNNNLFAGNVYDKKVFRFCDSTLTYAIYTDSSNLKTNESGSYKLSDPNVLNPCPYGVTPNIGVPVYSCPVVLNILPQYTSSPFTMTAGLQIATNTKSYAEFPEISRWMDVRRLYKQIETNSTFRDSEGILQNFYDSLQSEMLSAIETADDRLAILVNSMASQNYDTYLENMAMAESTNSNIVSEAVQDGNERDINEIYLKLIAYGLDALNESDSTRIDELANQCPYIAGTAVYKARPLYAMYYPASTFDDIKICNAIGVYKNGANNGKGLFDDENNYLKSLKLKEKSNAILFDDFMIYPNPTSANINIKYQLQKGKKGNVKIYDLLGREKMDIVLTPDVNIVSLSINSLQTGVYVFKYSVDNKTMHTVKLLKE